MFSKKSDSKTNGDVCREFKVIDYYEGVECLGYADTLQEACKIRKQQIEDTDGECDVIIKQKQPQGGYKTIS